MDMEIIGNRRKTLFRDWKYSRGFFVLPLNMHFLALKWQLDNHLGWTMSRLFASINCILQNEKSKIHKFEKNDNSLKYGLCNKSFRKDEPLTSWSLLQHICPHFWAWLLDTKAITHKSEDKYVVKVFNCSEVHLSEMACYKIHTLHNAPILNSKI